MKIVGAIAAYCEEGRIAGAVESLLEAGCDDVLVLDGAWTDANGRTFGNGPQLSTDGTLDEAEAAGARVSTWGGPGGDAEKQTALIHQAGLLCKADFVVRIDADERLIGELPEPTGHSLIWLHNHGENDLPDVRSTWPRGDDAEFPIPLFRCFKWSPDLRCVRPGRWVDGDTQLEPYLVGALGRFLDSIDIAYKHPLSAFYRDLREREALADPKEMAAFPILRGMRIDHFRDMSKVEAKRAYYEAAAA